MKSNALVLCGEGINCERETGDALRDAGFEPKLLHLNDFLSDPKKSFYEKKLLVIPGGFSYADELGSGSVMAHKIKHYAGLVFSDFLAKKGAVLGICNGFQVLTKLGVFGHKVALLANDHGRFINEWVTLKLDKSNLFTQRIITSGAKELILPIRHGEGRLYFEETNSFDIALTYEKNVNGSQNLIAGISAFEGRVFGLMPHPEAFWSTQLCPTNHYRGPLGIEFFKSAADILLS